MTFAIQYPVRINLSLIKCECYIAPQIAPTPVRIIHDSEKGLVNLMMSTNAKCIQDPGVEPGTSPV